MEAKTDFGIPDLTYPPTLKLLGPAPESAVLAASVPYRGRVEFGGMVIAVDAPCGCVAYYNTEELIHRESTLEPCNNPDCDFQWDEAYKAAFLCAAT